MRALGPGTAGRTLRRPASCTSARPTACCKVGDRIKLAELGTNHRQELEVEQEQLHYKSQLTLKEK